MPVFMLDTNVINNINCDETFLKKVITAVDSGKITLYITHIQLDEINEIPDSNGHLKSNLIAFVKGYCKSIPTRGNILGVSKLGACTLGGGEDIGAISQKNPKMIHDALIAVTTKSGVDFLVTDDDKLRRRVARELPPIRLLTNNEFHILITQL